MLTGLGANAAARRPCYTHARTYTQINLLAALGLGANAAARRPC